MLSTGRLPEVVHRAENMTFKEPLRLQLIGKRTDNVSPVMMAYRGKGFRKSWRSVPGNRQRQHLQHPSTPDGSSLGDAVAVHLERRSSTWNCG